ncbi:MAG TPA: sigma-70 family RNA polymerase sigma factor [Candidatus Binatia bacterium]|nr:sigma-70 family RNA polymerase sigma factor [Candidatus Binatia bacterium]
MADQPPSPTDWELVERARGGERAAFRALVERYQGKVAALALGMLRNREDALDVVQETFTRAYQSLDRFKGDAGFYTWIYRIALNLCVDQQRRDARMPQVPVEVLPDQAERGPAPVRLTTGEDDEPFARAHDAEVGRRLRAAIAELTPEHRAVILLREVDGLSYEEISRVLQCPKGTVMSRLHYARRQLQVRLRELL